MDITSLKNNILPNSTFNYNGKTYFYNKITSYDLDISFELKNGFYFNNTFINSNGDIYTLECFYNIYFGNEVLKICTYKHIHKSVSKNKKIKKSFLGIKYNSKDYDDEYLKILFTNGISSLKLTYLNNTENKTFCQWCLEKFNANDLYNNIFKHFSKFKEALSENNL